MKDLLNAGQILGRSEMKKIMAGCGGSGGGCSCDKMCPPNEWPVSCPKGCGECAAAGEWVGCEGCE